MSTTAYLEPREPEDLGNIMAERERDDTEFGIEYDRMNPELCDPEPNYY